MTILYAEDDIEDYNLFYEVAVSIYPDVTVINARNGLEAWDLLEQMTILPDFIFLDINMPSMDGKSCLKYIKRDKRFAHIPVIIYSTSAHKKDIDLCLQLGADSYIQKPNSVKEASDKLSQALLVKK
jgi:CheY-like chemotaxis protein